jgi:uncharacterized protein YdiU (UPF0061 family)
VAASHIRIGTFQFFAAQRDTEALHLLVDHVLERHYPEQLTAENRPLALLQSAISAQAALVARWQLLGFIHGVMNTDNMLLSGETVDYGPCAFMDAFNPETVFSSIDHAGRYAYRNQPGMAHWNLTCLAQSLLPLIDADTDTAVAQAQQVIDSFPGQFMDAHTVGLAAKLGLEEVTEEDTALIEDLFKLMADAKADFTLTFRHLADLANPASGRATVADIYSLPPTLEPWCERWRERLAASADSAERRAEMFHANPAYIPRNHLVEAAIRAAVDEGDLTPFNDLVDRLARPFDYDQADSRYALPPVDGEAVQQTFCGT